MKKIYERAEMHRLKSLTKQAKEQIEKNIEYSQTVEYIPDKEDDINSLTDRNNINLFKFFQLEAQKSTEIDLNLFPKQMREFGKNLIEVKAVPNNFIAGGFFAALSGAIGNSAIIKTDYTNTATVFIAILGNSGTQKSAPFEDLIEPLNKIDDEYINEYYRNKFQYENNIQPEGKKIRKPVEEQLCIQPTTLESILETLSDNPKGCLMVTEELSTFFGSLNLYRNGNDEGTYIRIWDNKTVKIKRRSSDGYFVKTPFMSIIGAIPPAIFKQAIQKIGTEDGFLWRFLPFNDPVGLKSFPNKLRINDQIKQRYNQYITSIHEFLYMNTLSRNFDNNRLEVKPFVYTLDEKSEKIWDDYRIFLTKRHRETPNNNEKMMISKIEIYCLRLALILHIAENHSDLKNNLEVNYTTIYNSIKLSEILLELMKQTFDMATGERISNFGVPKKYVDFYKTLPHGEFKRNVAKEKCNNFGISERSCFDFLKNTVFFVKTAYGHYMKILDIE